MQIDLLIDRADRIINLCEMKYSDSEFIIKKKDAEDLRRKMADFYEKEKVRKALHLVMVTTYGVKKNEYYNMVQNEVTISDLFD